MTHKLPLQPSESESAQMRADRLTLPVKHAFAQTDRAYRMFQDSAWPQRSPRIEFTGEKK